VLYKQDDAYGGQGSVFGRGRDKGALTPARRLCAQCLGTAHLDAWSCGEAFWPYLSSSRGAPKILWV